MSSAYIALGYACNQRCSFCPCTKDDKKLSALSLEEAYQIVDNLSNNGINEIYISGGEPTIHTIFIDILDYILKKDINVVVLSNSERFSNEDFFLKFKERFLSIPNKITIVTTIHSQNFQEHEDINGSVGSFNRTITGLKNLRSMDINVIVKHCITALNCKDLKKFYNFINSIFDEKVAIQMCSIDFCNMDKEDLEKNKIIYPNLKPYFKEMFNEYIADLKQGNNRHVYCICMPYCAVDPEYWCFLSKKSKSYTGYATPRNKKNGTPNYNVKDSVGTFSNVCQNCEINEMCPGTYYTAYELYGDSIFEPYHNL